MCEELAQFPDPQDRTPIFSSFLQGGIGCRGPPHFRSTELDPILADFSPAQPASFPKARSDTTFFLLPAVSPAANECLTWPSDMLACPEVAGRLWPIDAKAWPENPNPFHTS